MLISRKHNFIFIHIYKTAGTSIRTALKPFAVNPLQDLGVRALKKFDLPVPYRMDPEPFPIHSTASEVIEKMGNEKFNGFFSFAVVRNPWNWQVSLYNYMLQRPSHYQHEFIKSLDSFDDYIRWRCREEVRLQKDFIYSADGTLLVDYVGRFEQIDKDFPVICSRVGISATLPVTNVSTTRPYREYYSAESRELVREAFDADISLFEYEF